MLFDFEDSEGWSASAGYTCHSGNAEGGANRSNLHHPSHICPPIYNMSAFAHQSCDVGGTGKAGNGRRNSITQSCGENHRHAPSKFTQANPASCEAVEQVPQKCRNNAQVRPKLAKIGQTWPSLILFFSKISNMLAKSGQLGPILCRCWSSLGQISAPTTSVRQLLDTSGARRVRQELRSGKCGEQPFRHG